METSLEAMESVADIPSTDTNVRLLRDPSGRFVPTTRREPAGSAAENFRENEVKNNHGRTCTSVTDLLHVCKPLSVHLIRLPDSVVNKNLLVLKKKATGKKRPTRFRWRHGAFDKKNSREWRRKRKLRRLQMLKMLKPRTNDNKNNADEAKTPDSISADANFLGFESVTRDEPSPFGHEDSAIKIDETEQVIELDENSGSIVQEITVSEAREFQLSLDIDINAAPDGPDRVNDSDLPQERESGIVKSYDEPRNTPIVSTNDHSEHTTASLTKQDYNQRRNTYLRGSKEDTNQPISRHTAKRKSLLLSKNGESNERQRWSQCSKKPKYSPPVPCPGSVTISEGSNIGISNDNVASIQQERALPENLEEKDPRSVHRRRTMTKPIEINSMNEVVVVVNRLDNEHSPLIEKWKNKVGSARLDDVALNSRTSCPFESRSAKSNADDNDGNLPEDIVSPSMSRVEKDKEEGVLDSSKSGVERATTFPMPVLNRSAPYDEETKISSDIVMCDSNEDDSGEDDDEIIEFLSTKRRARPVIESSSSENESNDEEFRRRLSSRTSNKTPLINGSESRSDLRQKKIQIRQKKRTSDVDDSSSESSSNYIEPRRTRSFYLEENRNSPSLQKARIADWINYTNSADALNHEEIRIAPLTRSRSRAALDNSTYEDTFNASGISNNGSNRGSHDRISTHVCDTSRGTSRNEEINDNENENANGYTENVRDVVEYELNQENNVSRDSVSANHSDISAIDAAKIQREKHNENCSARKKLTAMKDAMVVLTRLEDLTKLSDDDGYSGNETEFRTAREISFTTNFHDETLKDDTDSNNDIDSRSDETELYCHSADPLEIQHSPINGSQTFGSHFHSRKSVSTNECGPTRRTSETSSQQDFAIVTRNEGIIQDSEDMGLSQESMESECDITLTVSQSTTQSDERFSQVTTEPDVELTLLFDEHDGTSTEISKDNSAEGILTDSNGNNDRLIRTPAAKSPEDLDEHCKRCHCEEHQRDNRRLKCQNISATHKCITCNSLFKDSNHLQKHRTSNMFCNAGFRCNVCQTNFMTLIELAKHRATCAEKALRRRNSVDQTPNEETTLESEALETTAISEQQRSRDKKQNQPGQKNPPKKLRSRPRCRVDNLACNVCSISFATKTALSEHLYKHSSVELQEAFRIAKAKAIADSQLAERAARKNDINLTKDSDRSAVTQVDSSATINSGNGVGLTRNLSANESQGIVSNLSTIATTAVSNDSMMSTLAIVCSCHRNNDQTPLDKTDLQIEMVLLCKYCQVLFRRRECIEVHYRTSTHCATDRTRERWPRLFCANCQLALNNWGDMRQHLEVHARQNSERAIRFVCNICRVVFVGFGTLFYNHWVSHSKDTMFVAGRYNFPKFSVQPIDGTEKLPAGARSDENYIFVAEHVCASCKKPFSMRRDLEMHQKSDLCDKNNVNTEIIREVSSLRLSCDACNLIFASKKALNDHGKRRHENRYNYVDTSKSISNKNFRCTKCYAMLSSVSAVEEHWKTDFSHKTPSRTLASNGGTPLSETVSAGPEFVTSSVDNDKDPQNRSSDASTTYVHRVTSTDEPRITEEPPVITLEEEEDEEENNVNTGNKSISQALVKTSLSQALPAEKQASLISVSSITSTESTRVRNLDDLPMLRGLLKNLPPLVSTSAENSKHRSKIRALEDPCVTVMLSETSSTNLSASLIIGDPREKSNDRTVNSNTDSYQILLSNQSHSRNMTMVLSRMNPANSTEEITELPSNQLSCGEKDKTVTPIPSDPIASLTNEPSSIAATQTSVPENTTELGSNRARQGDNEGKKNSESAKLSNNNQMDLSLGQSLKNGSALPEIIDIIDDVEECNHEQPSSNVNTTVIRPPQARIVSLDNEKRNANPLRDCRKPSVNQSRKDVTSIKIDSPKLHSAKTVGTSPDTSSESESCSNTGCNDSGGTPRRSKTHSAANKASKISFEEVRWNWMNSGSVTLNSGDSTVMKKQGFLRVKNLSELQAVKTHDCTVCNAVFDSQMSLSEHRRLHMCGGTLVRKSNQYPTGMSAALVLPDPSERPKTPEKTPSTLQTSGNPVMRSLIAGSSLQPSPYVSPRLFGVFSSQGTETTDQLSSIAVTTESLATWLPIASQQSSLSLTTRAETTTSSQNVDTRQTPYGQIQMNNSSSGEITNVMSIASINQDSFTSQQQQQQQQLVVSSVGSIALPDASQRLTENRVPALGYHVLPPMVVLPSAQSTKSQPIAVSQRSSSNNYLPSRGCLNVSPLTYQADRQNKYLCNICCTFRCDTLEAFNNHVTKHYIGWNSANTTQNSLPPSPVAMMSATTVAVPSLASLDLGDVATRQLLPNNTNSDGNQVRNPLVFSNWTVKDTPQGPVLVTPVANSAVSPHALSSFAQTNNRSVLRSSSTNASNNPLANSATNRQIVFRCMICKSALYKSYSALRNHVILVHGITDVNSLGIENIAEQSFHCTQCRSTTALFDCEEKYRQHVDNTHTNVCLSCHCVFNNSLAFRQHMDQCRISSSNDRNSRGSNC